MAYIIDGNNVMAVLHPDRLVARHRLLSALAKFITTNKSKIKIVFDGVPDDQYPENIKIRSIHILYARPGSDADTRIKELVVKSTFKRDITVVSSDKALVSFVRQKGTKALSSYKFRDMLEEAERRYLEREKRGETGINVDDWLDYFDCTLRNCT
jgi:predicted RNA-binding protein with PIN domain